MGSYSPDQSAGRLLAVVGPCAAVADPGDASNHDVTGMTVSLPRAGTYHFQFVVPITSNNTATVLGLGVAFSGTVSSLNASFATSLGQTVSDILKTIAVGNVSLKAYVLTGSLVAATAGDLTVRFNRDANTAAVAPGGTGFVAEK